MIRIPALQSKSRVDRLCGGEQRVDRVVLEQPHVAAVIVGARDTRHPADRLAAGSLWPDAADRRAYAARYGIEYPMLLAGIPDELAAKVPQIENLNSFPTTIFLGRDGLVREVHAGFPSKASGRFYAETTAEIQRIVEELLTDS